MEKMVRVAGLPKNISVTFQYMIDHSNKTTRRDLFQDPQASDRTIQIWRGKAEDIAKHLDVTRQSVYRTITTLSTMGCVLKIRHGSRDILTVYQIIKEPIDHEYNLLREREVMSGQLKLPNKTDRVQDSVNSLWTRVQQLERRVLELERRNIDLMSGRNFPA